MRSGLVKLPQFFALRLFTLVVGICAIIQGVQSKVGGL